MSDRLGTPPETPVEDRELVVLGVTLIALFYAIATLRRENRLPDSGLLIAALSALSVGLVATNVESFYSGNTALVINGVEHLAYLVHTLFLIVYLLRRRVKATP